MRGMRDFNRALIYTVSRNVCNCVEERSARRGEASTSTTHLTHLFRKHPLYTRAEEVLLSMAQKSSLHKRKGMRGGGGVRLVGMTMEFQIESGFIPCEGGLRLANPSVC